MDVYFRVEKHEQNRPGRSTSSMLSPLRFHVHKERFVVASARPQALGKIDRGAQAPHRSAVTGKKEADAGAL